MRVGSHLSEAVHAPACQPSPEHHGGMRPVVIEHVRARRVRLRIKRCGTLEVVVPPGFNRKRLPALLAQAGDWVARTRARLQRVAADLDAREQGPRPVRINLRAIEQRWSVIWPNSVDAPERTTVDGRRLILPRDAVDPDIGCAHLLVWLKRLAGEHLTPRLQAMAERHGLRFARVGFRNQKSRWGSCSTRGNISLNVRLLFLPPKLTDYVLMHELCHTLHPHHGTDFWYEMERICPEARNRDRALRGWRLRLPDWLEQ